jgi:hypothetical protein
MGEEDENSKEHYFVDGCGVTEYMFGILRGEKCRALAIRAKNHPRSQTHQNQNRSYSHPHTIENSSKTRTTTAGRPKLRTHVAHLA